jgi:hypothetical protein
MHSKKKTIKKRLQFDFTPDAVERLEALKERVQAGTNAAVVRNALGVYEFMIGKLDAGYDIELVNKDGERTQLMPLKF